MFTLTSTAPCLQIGPISSPSLTHIPHPPAPAPPQLVVSSKTGGERAQFLVQVARRVTHSDWGRASSFAPLLLLNVSLILSSSLCHSQLGEYKTFEGKRKPLVLFLLLQIMLKWPIAHHFRGALWATFQQIRFIFGDVVISTQYPESPAVIECKVLHHNCFGCS